MLFRSRGLGAVMAGRIRPVVAERPCGTGALIERLRQTTLLNADEIHDRLGLEGVSPASGGRGFLTHSPYEPDEDGNLNP